MENPQTELEKQLESYIYVDRLLVFLETEEGFRQVIVNKKQFKALSDAVIHSSEGINEEGLESVNIRLNLDTILPKNLFEGMEDYD